MNRRARQFRGAFTLLELIIAMTIVTIIAGGLFTALRISFKAQSHSEAAVESARTASLAMEFLRTDLQNTLQPGIQFASAFTGTSGHDDRGREADDLVLNTTAEGPTHPNGDGEIKQVELTVQTDTNGDHVLLRRVTSNLLAQVAVTPDDETLCRGVAGFTLEYFNGATWLPTWDSTQEDNTIPAAVRVTLDLERPVGSGTAVLHFVRIFPLPCSTAAQDSTVNTGEALP